MDGLVTVEFYEDTLHVKMIGAVYLEQKRMIEGLELIGRAICRARKINTVECAILDGNGNLVDNTVVYRGR
jgi:hypothetical protein